MDDEEIKASHNLIDEMINEVIPNNSIIIHDPRVFRDIMTPARIDICEVIEKRKPSSVGELARILHRSIQSVSRDLPYLDGIVKLTKKGRVVTPTLTRRHIIMKIGGW